MDIRVCHSVIKGYIQTAVAWKNERAVRHMHTQWRENRTLRQCWIRLGVQCTVWWVSAYSSSSLMLSLLSLNTTISVQVVAKNRIQCFISSKSADRMTKSSVAADKLWMMIEHESGFNELIKFPCSVLWKSFVAYPQFHKTWIWSRSLLPTI